MIALVGKSQKGKIMLLEENAKSTCRWNLIDAYWFVLLSQNACAQIKEGTNVDNFFQHISRSLMQQIGQLLNIAFCRFIALGAGI